MISGLRPRIINARQINARQIEGGRSVIGAIPSALPERACLAGHSALQFESRGTSTMRVALVSGNREKLPDAVIPFGLLHVAASIPARHTRGFIDLCFEDDPCSALSERLLEFQPDLVAIGMRNIQNTDYSGMTNMISYYEELIETARQTTSAPIVIGGSGFSVIPKELMETLRPDYGISGEAEQAFPALLEALESGSGFDAIGNLHRFEDETLIVNRPPKGFLDMRTLPRPDRSLVDPRYYERYGIDSLQTKRGCPLRCDYCTYPIIEGRIGRTREPADIVDELEFLADKPGVEHVFIVDSVFNLPRTHAKAVCREMIDRDNQMPWTCYANPLGFDAELADLMHRAGCSGMEVGSDSGYDPVLEKLRKGFTTRHIRDLHTLSLEYDVPDCHTFLLGTPSEDFDDVLRSLDFIVDLDPFSAILMAWVDDYEALDEDLARKRHALRERIHRLLDDNKDEFPWWSIPSLGVNYSPELFSALREHGLHGPLWQHLRGRAPARAKRRKRLQVAGASSA
jgi:radical SAM superfamily enzyme YgiQ (UPF0313 family)